MSNLCFWVVYFTIDAVYQVKAGFKMVIIRTLKSWQLAVIQIYPVIMDTSHWLGTADWS